MQVVLIVVSAALFVAAWLVYSRWQQRGGKYPPGPPRLPMVGNIFQLGANPHDSLAQLAKTYGPLMSLKLGFQFAVVVSSPEMAKEVLQKQGLIFSDRFNIDALCILGHNEVSFGFLPGNSDKWKKFRRITKEKLFSNPALEAGQALRQERLQKMIDDVSKYSDEGRPMNIGEAAFNSMSNFLFTTFFSVESKDYGVNVEKLKEHVEAVTRYMTVPNISDFFPMLAPLDLQGIRRKTCYHLQRLLEIVESMIEERLQARKAPSSPYHKNNDFLEMLIDIMEGNEYDLSIVEIKHLLVDLIMAGSDSSAVTLEWIMVELLLHPDKLAKLKAELKSVVGERRMVEESDISKLPYLQATIKEVLRYHPVAPLLLPRQAQQEVEVNGYTIPKNTRLIINFCAIGRDPNVWNNPQSFQPERFLGNNIDYVGQHFELIPFGSGRRMCPGIPLVNRMLPCLVGTLCHNFHWKLDPKEAAHSIQFQREEVFSTSLKKKNPLMVFPLKVSSSF